MFSYEPWFEPLSRRLLTLAIAVGWFLVELSTGSFDIWFWGAALVTALVGWQLFLSGRYGKAEA